MNKYKLIEIPKGNGSSTKDFNIESNMFYVSRGEYGGKKVTIIVFKNLNLEFCFEGIINFENEKEVIKEIAYNDINNIFKIIEHMRLQQYNDGFNNGVKSLRSSIKELLL